MHWKVVWRSSIFRLAAYLPSRLHGENSTYLKILHSIKLLVVVLFIQYRYINKLLYHTMLTFLFRSRVVSYFWKMKITSICHKFWPNDKKQHDLKVLDLVQYHPNGLAIVTSKSSWPSQWVSNSHKHVFFLVTIAIP